MQITSVWNNVQKCLHIVMFFKKKFQTHVGMEFTKTSEWKTKNFIKSSNQKDLEN